MTNYAVIDANGNIVNRVVLNGGVWTSPAGFTTVQETATVYEIGGTYIAGVYTAPPLPPPPVLTADQIAENARIATIRSDANRAAMLARLQGATAAQIDAWVTANVTTLSDARSVLGIILKLIALDSRQ